MNFPFSHPYYAGVSFLSPGTHSEHLPTADVILVIDCDLAWIPANDRPSTEARIFVIDSGDPLKENIGFWHVDAELVCKADAGLSLDRLAEELRKLDEQSASDGTTAFGSQVIKGRREQLSKKHRENVLSLDLAEETYPDTALAGLGSFTVPNLLGVVRKAVATHTTGAGLGTLFLNEGISNYPSIWSHLRPETAGSVLSSGGSSLGWALGAAIGACLGGEVAGKGKGHELVVAIVGDGSYLFGVPASAYWMARRYNTVCLRKPLHTCRYL